MSISSLNTSTPTLPATPSPAQQPQTPASQVSDSVNSPNVNLNAINTTTSVLPTTTTTTTTTTQLVKGKELISNKSNSDFLKIKVTNHIDRQIKANLNDPKPIIIANSLVTNAAFVAEQPKLVESIQEDMSSINTNLVQPPSVLTASKLNTPGLVKSKIMVNIIIIFLKF